MHTIYLLHVILLKGIASLEMLLSNDPPLGTWSIKAIYNDTKEYINTFSVEEYGKITIYLHNLNYRTLALYSYRLLVAFNTS